MENKLSSGRVLLTGLLLLLSYMTWAVGSESVVSPGNLVECMRTSVIGQLAYRVWNPTQNYYEREGIVGATVKVWSANGYGNEAALLATDVTFRDGLFGLVPNHESPLANIKPVIESFDLSFEKDGKLLALLKNQKPNYGCAFSNLIEIDKDGGLVPSCPGAPVFAYSGHVTDATQKPLPGAEISAYLRTSRGSIPAKQVKTTSEGRYSLNFCGEEGASVELVCKYEGYIEQRVSLPASLVGSYNFVLIADPSTCREISGVTICADKISSDANGKATFVGNVRIGGVIHFGNATGKLHYEGGRLYSTDCGGLYIDNVFLQSNGVGALKDVFIYNDNVLDLQVDPQAAATLTQNVTNRWLMAVGFPLTMNKLKILPDGIETGGSFWPPAWSDLGKIVSDINIETFRITRSGGIAFDFLYKREAKGQLFHPRVSFEKLELQIKHLSVDDYSFYGKVKTNFGMVNPLFEGAKTSVEPVLGFGFEKGNTFRFDTLGVALSTDYGWPIASTGFELYGGSLGIGKNRQSTDVISSIGGDVRIRPLGSKKVEAMFKAIAAPGEEFKFLDIKAGVKYQWSPYRFFLGTAEMDLAGKAALKGEVSLVVEDDHTGTTRLKGTFDFPKKDPKKEMDPIITGEAQLAITTANDNLTHVDGYIKATLQIPPYFIFAPGTEIPLLARPLFPGGKPLKIANVNVNYLDKDMWANTYVSNPVNGEKIVDVSAKFVREPGDVVKLKLWGNVIGLPPFDQQINVREAAGQERTFLLAKPTPGLIIRLASGTNAPPFRLRLPDGKIMTNLNTASFPRSAFYTDDGLKESCYIIGQPSIGKYEVIYDGSDLVSTEFYTLNTQPTMYFTEVSKTGNNVTVRWADDDPDDDARITLFIRDDPRHAGKPLIRGLSENDPENAFSFDISKFSNGRYSVYGLIEDGSNAPLEVEARQSFEIAQGGTPNTPANLRASIRNDTLHLSWDKNNAPGVQYVVSYSSDGALSTALHYGQSIALHDTNETSLFKIPELGHDYKIAVLAFKDGLISSPSNVVDINYTSSKINNAPSILVRRLDQRVVEFGGSVFWRIPVREPDGDPLGVQLDSDLNSRGQRITFSESQGMLNVEYQPLASETGWHWFTIRLDDGRGGVDFVRYRFLVADHKELAGSIAFNKSYYDPKQKDVFVKLESPLANQNEEIVEEIDVNVSCSKGSITIKALETGASTGTFLAHFELKSQLDIDERNDTLTAVYQLNPSWEKVEANAVAGDEPLPVTWIGFRAEWSEQKGAVLRWSTSEEVTNAYFEVERSTNARIFESIGKVAGAGTTKERNDYQFIDNTFSGQVMYYRIRQADFDGTSDYTRILAVHPGIPEQQFYLWPNPVSGILFIDPAQDQTVVQVRLLDVNGKRIGSYGPVRKIDTSPLTPGLYFIEVESDSGKIMRQRFMHQ